MPDKACLEAVMDSSKLRLVLIEWVDAVGCSSSWEELSDIDPKPVACRSVGWLLHDGESTKVIVPHVTEKHPNAEARGCGDMTIPTIAVRRIVALVEHGEEG